MKFNIAYFYLFMGLAMPGSIMFTARYVGQGSAVTKAETDFAQVSEMVTFPDLHLQGNEHANRAMDYDKIESPFWVDEHVYKEEADLFDLLSEPAQKAHEVFFDGNVTSILPHPQNPMAIIDSKPHRIGDELGEGWKLVGINGENRTIILMHKSGKHLVVELTKNQ